MESNNVTYFLHELFMCKYYTYTHKRLRFAHNIRTINIDVDVRTYVCK